tara:strand:+ start:7172 stop:8392 length:1221 start_codon:yes stop_codon:yes gene_type:complete
MEMTNKNLTIEKSRKMNIKKVTPKVLTTLLVLLTTQLFAQNAEGRSGLVPDDVLLWALVGVIALLIIVNLVLVATIKSISSDHDLWAIVKDKMDKSKVGVVILLIGVFGSTNAFAQTGGANQFVMGSDLFYALLIMMIVLLLLLFYQIGVLRNLMSLMKDSEDTEEGVTDTWAAALTDVVPIEREEEIMFEHEHDGIRELDNNLPPWWLWGFYATIIFSVFYVPYYHFGNGNLQNVEYEIAMQEAEEAKQAYLAGMSNLIDESNIEASMDEATLAEGREIYVANCVACHGDKGEGGVGPNFTDKNWIHGGGAKNIFKTIKYGVPTKGMIPWESQMSPGQMKSVTSYIMSLEGTNPPNQKEAQGEIWVDEGAEAEPAAPTEETPASEETESEEATEPDPKQDNTSED